MKKLFKIFIIFLTVTLCSTAYSHKTLVTALSWWSYLDKPWVKKEIIKRCGVMLAVQSYKDANEFNRSFELKDYDIAIFESTQLYSVENLFDIFNRD